MWPVTRVTEMLGISLPIVQAPMAGGATTPALVAAVSNAGGLGCLGLGYLSPDDMRKTIRTVRELTDKPFAVNLFIPGEHRASVDEIEKARKLVEECCKELNFSVSAVKAPFAPSFAEQMAVVLEEKVPVFSFTFGIPEDKYLQELKSRGVVLIGTATTLAEGSLLEEKGVDIVAAQGSEAGGHRGSFLGRVEDSLVETLTLTSSLVENIGIPVLASGGIMDAAGIVSALELGAAGVQMGTAFLTCTESGIADVYKNRILKTTKDETSLTKAYSGKYARGIKTRFMELMLNHENDILDYPIQNALTSPMRKQAAALGNTDFMSLFAGQKAYLCRALPAAELLKELNVKVRDLMSKGL